MSAESRRSAAKQGSMAGPGLTAGVCELDLKPEPGYTLGDGAPRAVGSLTPLFAKALVLEQAGTRLALVSLDLLGIDGRDAEQACRGVEQASGIPAEAVLLVCSHTHVAPSMLPTLHTYRRTFNPLFDEAAMERERRWVRHVIDQVIAAVIEADRRRQPASLGFASARLPWLSFNRRRLTRNYGAWTHWMGVPPDQALGVEGPIDPELSLIVVRAADHRPACLVWSYSGHNSFHFGDLYAADLAFTVQEAVDGSLGAHLPCLYLPGCSGNTNYFDFQAEAGLPKATEGIASAIMAVYREACTVRRPVLAARRVVLQCAHRDVSRDWYKQEIAIKYPKWGQADYGEREAKRFRSEGLAAYPVPLSVLRLGSGALVGLAAEPFVEFGLQIKRRSPFKPTLVASYANGYAGYIATRRAFINGSYEVWPVLNARVARDGGYLMVDKAVELLEALSKPTEGGQQCRIR